MYYNTSIKSEEMLGRKYQHYNEESNEEWMERDSPSGYKERHKNTFCSDDR